jgi:hypothetical protein
MRLRLVACEKVYERHPNPIDAAKFALPMSTVEFDELILPEGHHIDLRAP